MTTPYRPSNGSEGDWFQASFCDRCRKQKRCTIVGRTMAFDVTDPQYPKQWIRDDAGDATCTAFVPLGTAHFRHRTIRPAKLQQSLLAIDQAEIDRMYANYEAATTTPQSIRGIAARRAK